MRTDKLAITYQAALHLAAIHLGPAIASAIDHPARVRRPGFRADDVFYEPERLTDGDGVFVRVLVMLAVAEE
ncbi:hypothetical protein ACWD3I_43480, partial [Streptomyces sp. NPDC002817]